MSDQPEVPGPRRALAVIARAVAPGYSCCYRCGMPWKFTKPHTTSYTDCRGCFPLCEHCWGELTVEQRLPFYEQLLWDWEARHHAVEDEHAEAIIEAVMSGG